MKQRVSKWVPGTRVRSLAKGLEGWTGTVEDVDYAYVTDGTSVVLDDPDDDGRGLWFADNELEEL
ncbi:hypothetical protein ACIRBX_11850 [Kitasatospora sp. NPDC096147]|uniref:hypothetical protein n=1 Tax=Kitasatospora sp. NPDC096147 TaxID=3364093 RepID=UPI0038067AC1